MKSFFFSALTCLLLSGMHAPLAAQIKNNEAGGAASVKQGKQKQFSPGKPWYDTEGNLINAHGNGIIYSGKKYYWFGEKRGKHGSEGVNVYSSADLYNWKFEGLALAQSEDTESDITNGCLMERPKVIYNKSTGKYVMWFHLELKGKGYAAARAGVAVSDRVTGPYKFINSFRPNGNMSRDMNLFVDDDGAAYHIYSSDENMDLRVARLSDDFLSSTTKDTILFRRQREAPALFRYNNKYYLITSGCTGWAPNRASLHVSSNIFGPWELVGDPMKGEGAAKTYGGQSTYVLPVQGKKNAFIFLADIWTPDNLKESRYIWLPVQLKDEGAEISWMDNWDLGWFSARN